MAICTGTTAWSNLAGNPDVAVNNSLAACKSINKCSGIGLINAQVSRQKFSVANSKCGNFIIFLSLRFYVKSTLGWEFKKCNIGHFSTFKDSEF